MAIPGWYTDPAGAPGRFRYWDGQQWSTGTTTDPRDPPPASGVAPAPTPTRTARSRTPLVVGAVLLAVVLVAAIAIAVTARQPATVSPPTSSAPVSSPPETPAVPAEPTPTSEPSSACPVGDPTNRQPQVSDGRIHGGGLSFPLQIDYLLVGTTEALSWAYDVTSQSRPVDPTWSSSLAVGALLTTDGFETPKTAAALVMECTAPSPIYVGFTGRRDLSRKAVKIDGHRAYAIRSEIRVDNPTTAQTGDVVQVIVVDGDSPESLGMFWACVPIGDPAALAQLDRVIKRLRVD